jgi:hypothetical protein
MLTYYGMRADGVRKYASGVTLPIDDAQMFFCSDGIVSGSFLFGGSDFIHDSWLFANGWLKDGILQFDMVKVALRYSRDPVAEFVGSYDGEGTFAGIWKSSSEQGEWAIRLREMLSEPQAASRESDNHVIAVAKRWGSLP